jgi:glyoxylase-like metal-dependent hydrolase (beta-lactamase superfamily II)
MPLDINTFVLGPLDTNCYVVSDGTLCWLIDVGMWCKPLVEHLRQHGLEPDRILLTHGHGDHVGGVEYLLEQYPDVVLCCPAADAEMAQSPELNLSATFLMGLVCPEPQVLIEPGDELAMGKRTWTALDTSGHTDGGMSFYCPQEQVVFTGDALFCRGVGRTDIPNGDGNRLVRNIRENLLTLPPATRVLPGHGPETTIAAEAKANPFLL